MKAATIENRGGLQPGGYQPVQSPQCEADVVGLQPSYRKELPPRCMRSSQYLIDGKHYCGFHAGKMALDYLIRASAADQQTTPQETTCKP
jgi:hypothetical protein